MNFVEPIRDKRKIAQIKNLLRGQNRFRDLLFFTVGVNTALRASDLLALRVGDFWDDNGALKSRFRIREEKRGKRNQITVNDSIGEACRLFASAYPGLMDRKTNYVVFSMRKSDGEKPIQRVQAWKLVRQLCSDVGLVGNYGTHTLRKTWAYQARRAGVELTLIMEKLNHNSLAYTKRYIGITDDELADLANRLNL